MADPRGPAAAGTWLVAAAGAGLLAWPRRCGGPGLVEHIWRAVAGPPASPETSDTTAAEVTPPAHTHAAPPAGGGRTPCDGTLTPKAIPRLPSTHGSADLNVTLLSDPALPCPGPLSPLTVSSIDEEEEIGVQGEGDTEPTDSAGVFPATPASGSPKGLQLSSQSMNTRVQGRGPQAHRADSAVAAGARRTMSSRHSSSAEMSIDSRDPLNLQEVHIQRVQSSVDLNGRVQSFVSVDHHRPALPRCLDCPTPFTPFCSETGRRHTERDGLEQQQSTPIPTFHSGRMLRRGRSLAQRQGGGDEESGSMQEHPPGGDGRAVSPSPSSASTTSPAARQGMINRHASAVLTPGGGGGGDRAPFTPTLLANMRGRPASVHDLAEGRCASVSPSTVSPHPSNMSQGSLANTRPPTFREPMKSPNPTTQGSPGLFQQSGSPNSSYLHRQTRAHAVNDFELRRCSSVSPPPGSPTPGSPTPGIGSRQASAVFSPNNAPIAGGPLSRQTSATRPHGSGEASASPVQGPLLQAARAGLEMNGSQRTQTTTSSVGGATQVLSSPPLGPSHVRTRMTSSSPVNGSAAGPGRCFGSFVSSTAMSASATPSQTCLTPQQRSIAGGGGAPGSVLSPPAQVLSPVQVHATAHGSPVYTHGMGPRTRTQSSFQKVRPPSVYDLDEMKAGGRGASPTQHSASNASSARASPLGTPGGLLPRTSVHLDRIQDREREVTVIRLADPPAKRGSGRNRPPTSDSQMSSPRSPPLSQQRYPSTSDGSQSKELRRANARRRSGGLHVAIADPPVSPSQDPQVSSHSPDAEALPPPMVGPPLVREVVLRGARQPRMSPRDTPEGGLRASPVAASPASSVSGAGSATGARVVVPHEAAVRVVSGGAASECGESTHSGSPHSMLLYPHEMRVGGTRGGVQGIALPRATGGGGGEEAVVACGGRVGAGRRSTRSQQGSPHGADPFGTMYNSASTVHGPMSTDFMLSMNSAGAASNDSGAGLPMPAPLDAAGRALGEELVGYVAFDSGGISSVTLPADNDSHMTRTMTDAQDAIDDSAPERRLRFHDSPRDGPQRNVSFVGDTHAQGLPAAADPTAYAHDQGDALAQSCSDTQSLSPHAGTWDGGAASNMMFASGGSSPLAVTWGGADASAFAQQPQPLRVRARSRVRRESIHLSNCSSLIRPMEKTVNFTWKRGRLLGQGGFGKVHLGLNDVTGELMAVKNIDFSSLDKDIVKKLEELRKEIQIMQPLDHAHVVKYFFTERVGTSVNIFMEYIPGGSIQKVLTDFGPLSEHSVVQYTYQIVGGLSYLHANGIVHRDIKGANLLLTVDGHVKLADFGAAAFGAAAPSFNLDDVDGERQQAGCRGTPLWMAPEVIRSERHDWEADIWSLGCTVMEMLTAKHPWAHLECAKGTQIAILKYVVDEERAIQLPEGMAAQTEKFLWDCLQRPPRNRPAACELIEHEYFFDEEGDERSPRWNRRDSANRAKLLAAASAETMITQAHTARSEEEDTAPDQSCCEVVYSTVDIENAPFPFALPQR